MALQLLFHGSDHILKKPIFGKGKVYNDYGLGFYCTETLEMAKEWGVGKEHNGFANRYILECDGLNILNLGDQQYSILHWLAVLLENREFDVASPLANQAKEYILKTFPVEYEKCDCIIGYRADDSYFSFAQDFLNGTISLRQLNNAMHLGKLGQQFVLKSKEAFDRIQFQGYEIAEHEEWYIRKMQRDKSARREYFDLERNKIKPGDLFVTQMLTERMDANDTRIRSAIY